MPNAVPAQVLNNNIKFVALESASDRGVADASD
jgi:hypothetical protein